MRCQAQSSTVRHMRMFAAIRPSSAASQHLDAALLAVGLGWPMRVVPAEQHHITLAFYGEVPDGAADDLAAALAQGLAAAAWRSGPEPLTLALAGAGCFSGRSLWMGVRDEPAGALRILAEAAGEAATSCGLRLPDGDRPRFRAHLTVARMGARAAARAEQRGGRGRAWQGRRRGGLAAGRARPGPGRLSGAVVESDGGAVLVETGCRAFWRAAADGGAPAVEHLRLTGGHCSTAEWHWSTAQDGGDPGPLDAQQVRACATCDQTRSFGTPREPTCPRACRWSADYLACCRTRSPGISPWWRRAGGW